MKCLSLTSPWKAANIGNVGLWLPLLFFYLNSASPGRDITAINLSKMRFIDKNSRSDRYHVVSLRNKTLMENTRKVDRM